MKFDLGSLSRTLVLIIALVNQFLYMGGYSPLPFESAEIEAFVTNGFTLFSILINWYKNNFITGTGIKQKEALQKEGLTKAKESVSISKENK